MESIFQVIFLRSGSFRWNKGYWPSHNLICPSVDIVKVLIPYRVILAKIFISLSWPLKSKTSFFSTTTFFTSAINMLETFSFWCSSLWTSLTGNLNNLLSTSAYLKLFLKILVILNYIKYPVLSLKSKYFLLFPIWEYFIFLNFKLFNL
mgnify:CR=1 FL=1